MLEQLQQTVKSIRSIEDFQPEIGVILGTGLGGLVDEMEIISAIPYEDIPHFPDSTVHGHPVGLFCPALVAGESLLCKGVFIIIRGYSPAELTFPIPGDENVGY